MKYLRGGKDIMKTTFETYKLGDTPEGQAALAEFVKDFEKKVWDRNFDGHLEVTFNDGRVAKGSKIYQGYLLKTTRTRRYYLRDTVQAHTVVKVVKVQKPKSDGYIYRGKKHGLYSGWSQR